MRAVCIRKEIVRLERPALAVTVLRSDVVRGRRVEEVEAAVLVGVMDQLVDVFVLRVRIRVLQDDTGFSPCASGEVVAEMV